MNTEYNNKSYMQRIIPTHKNHNFQITQKINIDKLTHDHNEDIHKHNACKKNLLLHSTYKHQKTWTT